MEVDYSSILQKYARRHGRVIVRCTPSKAEVASFQVAGAREPKSAGKVIYDHVWQAEAAAREMTESDGLPRATYQCARSKNGHQHIKSVREHGEGT